MLRSLIAYWQNHPALSYLFSGLFVGPTSQSPRVDEARDDHLYELEFRAFEMPLHKHMSAVQMLLLRTLVARFWKTPYQGALVRWGTALHDRWMLPHFVEADVRNVAADLNGAGYAFEETWFVPFLEFRFPRFGTVNYDGVGVELRQAIEPWHVLGEEMSGTATARYVDSSVERLQVKVTGTTREHHCIACNGRAMPLVPTGMPGEFVAGLRFRAWNPPSALHPMIGVQAPLVFDVVDTWASRAIGGCTYHVVHPGVATTTHFRSMPMKPKRVAWPGSGRMGIRRDQCRYSANRRTLPHPRRST